MYRPIAFALLALFLVAGAPGRAGAQTGSLTGRILAGKEPAVGADVQLLGTRLGTATADDGSFRIPLAPVGTHVLRVRYQGWLPKDVQVLVDAGPNAVPVIKLAPDQAAVKTFGDVVVRAERKLIDLHSSMTSHNQTAAVHDLPIDSPLEAVKLTAGVVATGDNEFHFRGSRADEVGMRIDGLPVNNPLSAALAPVAKLAVSDLEVLTGGLDAEYGGALGGIISVSTREGTDHFEGEGQWHTDRYGESGKTFNNYDRITLGMGGPTPVRALTYFLTYEGVFSDTYLDAGKTQSTKTVFDFLRLGDRQSNQVNANAKLAWHGSEGKKLTLEALGNRSRETPYVHMWSRKGYVSVTQDTTTGGDGATHTAPVYGLWSFFPEDSTYQYQNLADHVPTNETTFDQVKAVWTQPVGSRDVMVARVGRYRYRTLDTVGGKEPWEYDTQSPLYWSGNLEADPFFVTHGDYPTWTRERTTTWTAKADYSVGRWKRHMAKAGVEAVYNSVELLDMQFPNQEAGGQPGLNRSDFTNYNPEGSAFVQDRWEYEGLVLNAGMRYDLFTPGMQVPDSDLPHGRYKGQWSPRLGVAYPISDRDVLSLHYGWTFQTPPRNYVFENRGSQSTVDVRGNPDLSPETNVSYQAAVQHMFSRDVAGQFAVFFKDIYGLIATRQEIDAVTGLLVPVYVNRDYASSRGFETSFTKRFSHKFSAEFNYTYSIATGVASDPNDGLQFAQGNALYLPIAEQPLRWDQRHTLNANVILRDPGKWGVTFLWTYGSGLPYTPTFRNDRKPDPRYAFSRRLPSSSELSILADKYFHIWGQNVTFFLDARNVLDATPVKDIAPDNFPNPYVNQVGNDYSVYYTETGRAGGAYLRDTNGDGSDDWVAVNDPRVFAEGRNVRVGVGVAF